MNAGRSVPDAAAASVSRYPRVRIRPRHVLRTAAIAIAAILLLRTAWVSDDAYITFRTVANVLHGYGARWNAAERVQAYTHPLWMWLLVACQFVTGEPYWTAIALGILCALVTIGLLMNAADSPWQAALAAASLCASNAFIDFSTSGLENSLSHVLIAAYIVVSARRVASSRAIVLGSLALVNRLDLIWLLGPSLAVVCAGLPRGHRWRIAAGLAPLVVWELCSILYYGFPFPNTAYAKLDTGIGGRELVAQGLWYVLDALRRDPVTMVALLSGAIVGVVSTRPRVKPDWFVGGLAAGMCLYVGYVICIGGDFMSGRFFTAPLVAAVAIVVRARLRTRWAVAALAAATALSGVAVVSHLRSGPSFGEGQSYVEFHGITDERAYYFPRTGLLRRHGAWRPPSSEEGRIARRMVDAGQTVATRDMVGMFGFAAGPDLYVVDLLALGDPLLARLPASGPWRIGHFHRDLPAGYIQTLRTGRNQIQDAGVAAYYDELQLITRGPIFALARWKAIVSINAGRMDHLLDGYRAGLSPPRR